MIGDMLELSDIRKYMSDEWNSKVDTVLELEKLEWAKPEPNIELATTYRIRYLDLTETIFESGVAVEQNDKKSTIILFPMAIAMRHSWLKNRYPVYFLVSRD